MLHLKRALRKGADDRSTKEGQRLSAKALALLASGTMNDAYVESGGHFVSKRSIFEKAVERLTKEANPKVAKGKRTLPSKKIVQFASEVVAKLLLSGAEGIGTSEALEANGNRMYPLLTELFEDVNSVQSILATRLFKPGDNANQHRPVHKIVAEYCAADYLTKRIADL
jgi:hypothetical protein